MSDIMKNCENRIEAHANEHHDRIEAQAPGRQDQGGQGQGGQGKAGQGTQKQGGQDQGAR